MESPGLSDPKQPKDDVSQSSSSAANVDRSETPDSNRGPGDDESAADSPKITKPVLGKAQAKKRLMAFANKFPPSVIQKPVEKSFSFNKNRNINSFQVNKKKSKDSIKNLVTDANKSKNKDDTKMETTEKNDVQLPTRSSPTKKTKKRVEPKLAAIEEIIREDAKQKLLLTNYLTEKKNDIDNFILNSEKNDDKNNDRNDSRNNDRHDDRNDDRNNDRNDDRNNDRNDDRNNDRNDDRNNERNDDRNDRNKNFGRHQQWDRRNQYFHNDNFRRGNFNQNHYGDRKFHDRRWQFNDFRDRSRSRERRNDNFIRNRRRSNSLDMDQQHKMKIHKHDKPYFNKHRNYNNHRKDKREEQFEPIEQIDWRSFKRQGGQIRAKSLSVDINDDTNTTINKEVKFKTPQEYNAQLHHMLMIGTHHVKRTCVTVDGINETKKQYPPESIRITKKHNGQGLFYCENPNISLLLPCQQLYQMLPPDRSDHMRKISHAVAGSSKENLDEEEQGPRKWFGQIQAEPRPVEYEVKDIDKSSSPARPTDPPKSRWDSEDEAAAAVDDSSSSSSEGQSETSDNEEDDGNKKEEGNKEEDKDKVVKITPIVKEDLEEEVVDNDEKAEKDEEEDKVDEDEEMSSSEKVNLTPASSVNEIMPNEDVSNEVESDKIESNDEISSKDMAIEVVSGEITATPTTDNSDDKSGEKVEVGEKLVSEYEQFMKMVANEEEVDNTQVIVQTDESESPMKAKVESKVVYNPPITDECSKKNDDQDVEHASDIQNLDPVVEGAPLIHSKSNSESTPVKIEKIDKTIELDPGISDWANIRGTTKHRRSSKSDKLRKRRERKKKKYRKKVSSSDSSDSSSSSSESEDEKRKRKRKRKRKKKRARDSSSDSSSSDSDDSSDESSHSSKKKRKKRKNRKKLRLRNKKKRVRKDSTVSNSSFEFDEITRKRKKRKDSKQRRVSKRRRSKSTEKKRIQKMNRKNKIENESLEVVIKEEVSHSPHWEAEVNNENVSVALNSEVTRITGSPEDKASAQPVAKVPSAEKLFEVCDNNSSSQVISQQPDDSQQEEPKIEEPQQEEILNEVVNEDTAVVEDEHQSVKDIESVHHSPVDKPSDVIEITTDTVSDHLSEKKSKRDSSRSKKVKKIKKKRRSISTSSTSSNSSSGSSDGDSSKKKKSREKRKKKNRSKRRSPSQSELIKKLKKYRAKLSESFDFDALHFPSLTQLEESNENLPVINDWEVDSLDALEKFASNSSKDKSTAKIDKKVEKGLLYDSKTDTYIAIEKNKTQRENKKKQVNRICPLRIWEDEEEEGEREAKMLMEEKIKKENESKVEDEQPAIEPVASSPIPSIVEEEKEEESKPIDLPVDSAKIKEEDAKEEKPSGWVEIIPESEDKVVEIVPEQQVPPTTRWAEPSPVLLKEEEDLGDDNLAPVNWEEEEVDWESQSSFITGVKSAKASKSRRESSDSSSDSSDSSSSSESSDSDTQNDKRSRHKHDSSSKSKYSGSKNPSPAVETEAMKKLRMNIFAEFEARESTGDFTQLSDTKIDIDISSFKLSPEELLSSKSVEANKSIESSEIHIPKFDDTRFVARDKTDGTVEKGTFRQSFQEVRLRSYSRSPECDSKRSSSSRNDNEKSKTRSSEDRGSASSYRSSSRGSVKDRSKIDNKDFKVSSFTADHKKISPLSDRGFKDKKRSPVSWNRSRSRSRSWSRSRSRTPSRRDDRLSWDRQKRTGRVDDKRERFSRSPDRRGRLKAFTNKDRSHRSTESDRNRERDHSCDKSHERDWSREKLGDKPYDPMEILRGSYNIDKKRPSDLTERPHDALDMYHKNVNLEKDSDTLFTSELDKPRYRSRSRSRSRERRSRDIDWDRSRETPDSCRGTRVSDTRKSSRLSPRSRGSPSRSSGRSRYAGRSRSRSWSRSRSRSRSRSISRFRSRSRSSSRSRSRLGLRNSDRSRRSLDRSRHSRSFSPEQRKLNIISDMRYQRSTSKERIQKIETIIHPSGINSLSHEESQSVPQIDDSNNIPVPTQQFEYSYYGGNNLTYPPRLETTTITTPAIPAAPTTTTPINPPVSSPKRLSLDDRLELELGIKKNQESLLPPLPPLPPPPPPHPYNIPKYNQQAMSYPPPTPGVPVLQPRIPPPLHPPPYVRPQQPTVLQVGNVLQVVPADFSGPVPPVGIRNDIPTPPSSTGNNNSNRTLRVGNVIQVLPSTSLDWSGPVPPPTPAPAPIPTLAPSLPPLPMSSVPMAVPVPVPMPIGTNVPVLPAVSLPMMVPVPSISHIQPIPPPPPPLPPPPPIAALPKLEPPKAPPLLQPIYNYEAIMEVRRKEKEERKRLREEKRLEKERKKIEKMRRRAKRTLGQSSSRITADLPVEPDTTIEGEAVSAQPKPLIDDEDLDDPIAAPLGQPDENVPEDEDEEEYDEGDVEEDDEEEDDDEEPEAEVEDDESRVINSIDPQPGVEIPSLNETVDEESTSVVNVTVTTPLPPPPRKGILVPPGLWDERIVNGVLDDDSNTASSATEVLQNNTGDQLLANLNEEKQDEIDPEEKRIRTPRQRRSRKSVQFADGIKPGEGTSPSGGEGDMPSPPPPAPMSLHDPLHEHIRRSRSRKNRKKAKRAKPLKIKKKVKVKIIKLKKPKITPLTSMMLDDLDDLDDRSPPPPPPGSPPPPHLWPSYLAAYSAILRPVETTSSPSTNQAPPPPTPLPLLVPPPPLNYTIQPCNKA
ncbi:serine/arginine repetitive matrix protein 2-like [Microplitis mediator]|uniref:serine/arginine repetitive matrix protein 2-like n=1 Tax=Microplitis mediator TaxID=375433 RepID=UPI002554EA2B|nr:serine/arginine repetitive matrix protein 2-like [Microplitis mediator]